MPTPVPDFISEEWLIPKVNLQQCFKSLYWGKNAYSTLTLKARNTAAKLLFEYMTWLQVGDLRATGTFIEGQYLIRCSFHGYDQDHPGLRKTSVKTKNEHGGQIDYDAVCVAYGTPNNHHELLPICDRLLALLLMVRSNAVPKDLGGDYDALPAAPRRRR